MKKGDKVQHWSGWVGTVVEPPGKFGGNIVVLPDGPGYAESLYGPDDFKAVE